MEKRGHDGLVSGDRKLTICPGGVRVNSRRWGLFRKSEGSSEQSSWGEGCRAGSWGEGHRAGSWGEGHRCHSEALRAAGSFPHMPQTIMSHMWRER